MLPQLVCFKSMVEQDDTGDHTNVCRFPVQCQSKQLAMSRLYKGEATKIGRLLCLESCVSLEEGIRDRRRTAFVLGPTQQTTFDQVLRSLQR
jgi:hypothetical protein